MLWNTPENKRLPMTSYEDEGMCYREKSPTWETVMADRDVMHVDVAPLTNLDPDLVRSTANVINESPSCTRLLLAGEVPKGIAHCDSMQKAESIVKNLRDMGLAAIACRDSELRQFPQTFKARTPNPKKAKLVSKTLPVTVLE
jgi:hypothetical protein